VAEGTTQQVTVPAAAQVGQGYILYTKHHARVFAAAAAAAHTNHRHAVKPFTQSSNVYA
jgi:hypothetical protein